jgi:gas vesicle protein
MNTSGKILAAVAAGIAAGAVLGILFAPDKGSETRRKINEQGRKITDNVKDKFRKGREKFNDLKEDIEQTVKEKIEEFA